MFPTFFSINLRCPKCRIVSFYADTVKEDVVCDYCSYTFVKSEHIDVMPAKAVGVRKYTRRKLLENLNK